MTILAFVWAVIKLIALFFSIMFTVTFILDPIQTIQDIRRTVTSWKLLYQGIKLAIQMKILNYKINKGMATGEPYIHVIRRVARA